MELFRNPRNGFVFVVDSEGVYPFKFNKSDSDRFIKGRLREWHITTRQKVDVRRFTAVKKVNLSEMEVMK